MPRPSKAGGRRAARRQALHFLRRVVVVVRRVAHSVGAGGRCGLGFQHDVPATGCLGGRGDEAGRGLDDGRCWREDDLPALAADGVHHGLACNGVHRVVWD